MINRINSSGNTPFNGKYNGYKPKPTPLVLTGRKYPSKTEAKWAAMLYYFQQQITSAEESADYFRFTSSAPRLDGLPTEMDDVLDVFGFRFYHDASWIVPYKPDFRLDVRLKDEERWVWNTTIWLEVKPTMPNKEYLARLTEPIKQCHGDKLWLCIGDFHPSSDRSVIIDLTSEPPHQQWFTDEWFSAEAVEAADGYRFDLQ